MVLYVGERSEREWCHLLGSLSAFSHFPHFPQVIVPFQVPPWCWFPGGWACAHSRTPCAPPMESPVIETGSFSCHCNPHRFLQPEILRLYFPTLEPWATWSVLLPSCSSWLIRMQIWDCPVHQPPPCCISSLPGLSISTPPTSLDECFFFNSLVVRLPYGLTFWQLWLFLFFKLVVILLLVVQGSAVYLCMPPSCLEALELFQE